MARLYRTTKTSNIVYDNSNIVLEDFDESRVNDIQLKYCDAKNFNQSHGSSKTRYEEIEMSIIFMLQLPSEDRYLNSSRGPSNFKHSFGVWK